MCNRKSRRGRRAQVELQSPTVQTDRRPADYGAFAHAAITNNWWPDAGRDVTGTGDRIYLGNSNPMTGQSNRNVSVNGGRTDQNAWTSTRRQCGPRRQLTLLTIRAWIRSRSSRCQRASTRRNGRNMGARSNVVTKRHQQVPCQRPTIPANDKLAANNFFNNANKVNLARTAQPGSQLRYTTSHTSAAGHIPRFTRKIRRSSSSPMSSAAHYVHSVQSTVPTAMKRKDTSPARFARRSRSTCTASPHHHRNIDPWQTRD